VIIDKRMLKVLSYIYKHHGVPVHVLVGEFPFLSDKVLQELSRDGYISIEYAEKPDKMGQTYIDVGADCPVALSEKGNFEVERSVWFDWSYVIRNIVVPLLIGVLTSLITTLLLRLL